MTPDDLTDVPVTPVLLDDILIASSRTAGRSAESVIGCRLGDIPLSTLIIHSCMEPLPDLTIPAVDDRLVTTYR